MTATQPPRHLEYVRLDEVEHAPRNPKAHDTEAIGRSISHHGMAEVPLRDERTGRLVAGHGRHNQLTAMHAAGETAPDGIIVDDDGMWRMPVVAGWSSRSDADAEAYLVGSNQITTAGGWDDGLADILRDLQSAGLTDLTGFTDDDIAALLDAAGNENPFDYDGAGSAADADSADTTPPTVPITESGDIWTLGRHRILCGDCREPGVVERVMDGTQANVAFTSPPYASQRKYDETSGFKPIPPGGYVEWFDGVQAAVRSVLAGDGSWFVNIKEHAEEGQRHLYVKDLTIAHVRQWGWRFVDEFAWTRGGVPGTWPNRFKNGFEPVFHFCTQAQIKFRPQSVGSESDDVFHEGGRVSGTNRTGNVGWSGTGVERVTGIALPSNVLKISASPSEMSGVEHSAVFPMALPQWFIKAYSDPGDAILDPFMGSGTTLIAAHIEDRTAYGTEISPGYCDIIARRYQELTGELPHNERLGEPVDLIGAQA